MDWKMILQIAGAVLGLLYIWLEYRASIWLWVVGILMPAVHSVLYFKSGLYADCGMQVYYVLAGIWGLVAWLTAGHVEGRDGKICRTPERLWPALALVYGMLHAGLYLFLRGCTDSTVPFWDAMTTALSVVAMWMLSRKYIEQWLVWVAVDIITVALYFYKGIPVTACLYLLYTGLGVVGYFRWKSRMW